jgi:hypothetical protein
MRTSQSTYCELTNLPIAIEIGNVLRRFDFSEISTVTDKKIPHTANGTDIDWYMADITSASDYYPFGSPMDGRTFSSDKYRFGFNEQEKDDEVAGAGNINAALYWEYDTRLGRRWNLDPKQNEVISYYACYKNNPIINIDINGDTPTPKEAAEISAHVYGDKKNGILSGGWMVSAKKIKDVNFNSSSNGLKSQLYERIITVGEHKGEKEYVYATAGTNDFTDVIHDATQAISGFSTQYAQSVNNAVRINKDLGENIQLTFVAVF